MESQKLYITVNFCDVRIMRFCFRSERLSASVLLFTVFLSLALKATGQSLSAIPLDEIKLFQSVQTVRASNGFDVYNSKGKLLKSETASSDIKIKAYVARGGRLFLMSDWSYEQFRQKKITPNWMVVHGLKSPLGSGAALINPL